MQWLGMAKGIFRLHDSDNFCGSFISQKDIIEILKVKEEDLITIKKKIIDDEIFISESNLYFSWSKGLLNRTYPLKVGSAKVGVDELILKKLIEINFSKVNIELQAPFRRKRVDLLINYNGNKKAIEFLGPGHFVYWYNTPQNNFDRKKEIEDFFGCECILWPYWILRCSKNIKNIYDKNEQGLAALWSANIHFGDFQIENSDDIVLYSMDRFNALRNNNIGYIYSNAFVNKPIHPIIENILNGKEKVSRLIPKNSKLGKEFWLPNNLLTK